ncbi:uncharacterized protein LOC133892600 [Phragmites australis]|uniref:uncharacterized protein LOC133892600 n=1 Tax=Phragmites australis TaxID=29695 RepID=UPI002D76FDA8|nr:uncharacterized protein LOC133892600 [Phragmites australis]
MSRSPVLLYGCIFRNYADSILENGKRISGLPVIVLYDSVCRNVQLFFNVLPCARVIVFPRSTAAPPPPLRDRLPCAGTPRNQNPSRLHRTQRDDTKATDRPARRPAKEAPRARRLVNQGMVFSSAWLAAAARVPAELCQRPGRRRLRADEVLRALFLLPARELGRLADCLVAFFCLPLPEYYVPGSGRSGGWVARVPGAALYTYQRSFSVSSSSSSSYTSSMSSSEEDYY